MEVTGAASMKVLNNIETETTTCIQPCNTLPYNTVDVGSGCGDVDIVVDAVGLVVLIK